MDLMDRNQIDLDLRVARFGGKLHFIKYCFFKHFTENREQ